ncbi:hypothetical protein B484DRAFT_239358 [Ochromonadaceae sp. CCMP2298]|nr:hypothetical protein B484DRAFT_239358 [Ochromonadaceae sp. CCMP2298]
MLLPLKDRVLEISESLLQRARLQSAGLRLLRAQRLLLVQALLQHAHGQLPLAHALSGVVVLAHEGLVAGLGAHQLPLQPPDQQLIVPAALQLPTVLPHLRQVVAALLPVPTQSLRLLGGYIRQFPEFNRLPLRLLHPPLRFVQFRPHLLRRLSGQPVLIEQTHLQSRLARRALLHRQLVLAALQLPYTRGSFLEVPRDLAHLFAHQLGPTVGPHQLHL